ncbi:hypothetical protein [Myceligenerans cantabricum]
MDAIPTPSPDHGIPEREFLGNDVAGPGAILNRMSPLQHLISRSSINLLGTPICIGLSNVTGVLDALTEYYQRWTESNRRVTSD